MVVIIPPTDVPEGGVAVLENSDEEEVVMDYSVPTVVGTGTATYQCATDCMKLLKGFTCDRCTFRYVSHTIINFSPCKNYLPTLLLDTPCTTSPLRAKTCVLFLTLTFLSCPLPNFPKVKICANVAVNAFALLLNPFYITLAILANTVAQTMVQQHLIILFTFTRVTTSSNATEA